MKGQQWLLCEEEASPKNEGLGLCTGWGWCWERPKEGAWGLVAVSESRQ